MDAPRSRRSPPLAAGGGRTPDDFLRPLSPTKTPLLPGNISRHYIEAMSLDTFSSMDKKSGRVMQLTWILLLATAGTLFLTVAITLKVPFNLSFLAQSGSDISTLSTGTGAGRIKNQSSDRVQQQLVLQALANPGVGPNDDNTTILGGSKSTLNTDKSIKGLLADFSKFESQDECASRGHRPTKYIPTPHLIQRLRDYEALHRKCARFAENFENNILQNNSSSARETEHVNCRFVVWIPYSGLGNRLLSLVSAFLYALLTNRILLVDRSTDMSDLFCEPFPGTSWLVPPAFPRKWLADLNETSEHRFGRQFNTSVPSPAFSYVHLTHTYKRDDRMFFCDHAQDYLNDIPWLFMRANNYIVPGMYFLSSFRPELDNLFSEKESIFHLLGTYLFHPSNTVWDWINRFRNAYLANNGKQVGLQIRTFNDSHLPYFQEQLSRCALENGVLPKLMPENSPNGERSEIERSDEVTSVLVTSLQPEYYEKIRDSYLSAPTQDGQFVAVHQSSHEGWQKTGTFRHDLKAWADIYLLSFSDVLVTSGWSTFGYAAQALAAVKPWILVRSFNYTIPNPPCIYARSVEPCFHTPPLMDCMRTGIPRNPTKLLPFVQSCEDVPWGIKLVENVPVV